MTMGVLEIGVSSRNSQLPYSDFKRILITSAVLFSKLVIIPVRVRNKLVVFSDFGSASKSIRGGRWVKDENVHNYPNFILTEVCGEDPLAGHCTLGSPGEVTAAAGSVPEVLVWQQLLSGRHKLVTNKSKKKEQRRPGRTTVM